MSHSPVLSLNIWLNGGHIIKSTVLDFICDPDKGFQGTMFTL